MKFMKNLYASIASDLNKSVKLLQTFQKKKYNLL